MIRIILPSYVAQNIANENEIERRRVLKEDRAADIAKLTEELRAIYINEGHKDSDSAIRAVCQRLVWNGSTRIVINEPMDLAEIGQMISDVVRGPGHGYCVPT